MKEFLLTLMLSAGLAVGVRAQTNAPAAPDQNINITSQKAEFDLKSKVAVYAGEVRVEGQGFDLACEVLTARLPATGDRIESFVGESNVVINLVDEKGQKIHGTGDKLIYTFATSATGTNETIELLGNSMLETPQGSMSGDAMVYDRITSKLTVVTNAHGWFRAETRGKTNAIASPKPEPAAQTNAP